MTSRSHGRSILFMELVGAPRSRYGNIRVLHLETRGLPRTCAGWFKMTQCSSKKACYKTKEHAEAEINRRDRPILDDMMLKTYQCMDCGSWHLTSVKVKLL